mgnify:CR=1 FL=1|jgi:hypothetical protein|tara:strand:- start:262 stop:744 length:483 start_codon:yes stop_codon:yes gene_type:complete
MNSATLENTNNNMQPDNLDNKNMKADDSNLVDEILTELNDDSNINNGKNDIVSLTGSENQPMLHNNDMMNMTPDLDIPPQMDVEYDSEENTNNNFMKKMRKPLIVLVLCFIVFNPYILSFLTKYMPRVFNEGGGMLLNQGRVLLLASIVALLFFGSNLLD